jgi:ankyrin repeat protein
MGKSEKADSFDFIYSKRLARISRELTILQRAVMSEYPDDDLTESERELRRHEDEQSTLEHKIDRQLHLVKRDREHHTLSTGMQLICASMRNDVATMRRLLANPNASNYVNTRVLMEGRTMPSIERDLGACPSEREMFREKNYDQKVYGDDVHNLMRLKLCRAYPGIKSDENERRYGILNPFRYRGPTALHYAARLGNTEVVSALLANSRTDVNARDEFDKWTPLHEAAWFGKTEVVKLLLRSPSSEVNAEDWYGATPLHVAVINEQDSVVDLLLDDPAVDVNAQTGGEVKTPVLLAAEFNKKTFIIRRLLDKGADIRVPDLFIFASEGAGVSFLF